MKTLILTEKPSVARDFARALGVSGKKDGYMENDRYIIAWAVGHLVELYEPDDYDAKWKRWRLDALPIVPDNFRYKPISKTKKQLGIIRGLLAGTTPDRVVIATDAGREGEVIARTILLYSGVGNSGAASRFWTSQALTPGVVKEGMKNLRRASDYDRLWKAGQARQIADWLVGMNGSRAATIRMNDLFTVGRVQTAVLSLLVDRRRERERFTPEPFWVLHALFSNEKGRWRGAWLHKNETRFQKEEEAQRVVSRIVNRTGTVLSVQKRKKKEPPPLLYSLTDLQQDANRRFGFTAKMTLTIAQDLYEKKKCLSYPRTDSKVLGTKNASMVGRIVQKLSAPYPGIFAGVAPERLRSSYKRVFNDARLTDHHALIPLAPLPASARADEKKIYDAVLKRFAAAFHPDCEFEQTEIITGVREETFRTRGKRIVTPGWQVVLTPRKRTGKEEEASENLPPLAKGDPARVEEADAKKKMTKPPPEYTEALLLKDMTNPARYVSENELKKIYRGDVGLGTQATRAQIIETLLARKYVARKKKLLLAADKGCVLIDALRRFESAGILASPRETARWEMQLDRIARGRGSDEAFLDGIKELVAKCVEEFKTNPIAPGEKKIEPILEIGTCPACGGAVVDGGKGFGCANWREEDGGCRFVIWKTIARKKISPRLARTLLTKRVAGPVDGFISKKKKTFSARLTLAPERGEWKVKFDFSDPSPANPSPKEALGVCPLCGGHVIEGKRGYGCGNWRREDGACRFVIWKSIGRKTISESIAVQLLKEGVSRTIEGFQSKSGDLFSAKLKLERNPSGAFEVVFAPVDDRMRGPGSPL